MRVLCVGGANVDYCGRASVELAAGQSAPGRVTRRIGGVAVNVALGVREISHMAGKADEVQIDMGTVVGEDLDGRGVDEHLRAHDIGTDMVLTRDGGATGAYLAIQDTSGQTMLGIGDTRSVESLTAGEARDIGEAGAGYDVLFIDCNIPAGRLESIVDSTRAASQGEGGGTKVVCNTVSPEKAVRVRRALPYIHTLTANYDEARRISGCDDMEGIFAYLLGAGVAGAVVTRGSAGMWYNDRRGRVHHYGIEAAALESDCGLGDFLAAGLVFGLLDREVKPLGERLGDAERYIREFYGLHGGAPGGAGAGAGS